MKIKYPRTKHFSFSPGIGSDDKVQHDLSRLEGKPCFFSIKMDGENTSLYSDGIHARSLDSRHHPSRDWVKQFHNQVAHLIPKGWRICGENLYAQHSIGYDSLPSYFLGFSIWDENNYCLSWDDTLIWFDLIGITAVSGVRATYSNEIMQASIRNFNVSKDEGIVVRTIEGFHYDDFDKHVVKWVRVNHVQTNKHWSQQEIIPNKLRENYEF